MVVVSHLGVTQFFPKNSIFIPISLFTLSPAFLLLVVFIHEMGHACAAWTLKHRVHIIAVGLLGFDPENKRIVKIEDFSNSETAGFVLHSPIWPLPTNPKQSNIITLCGPLATIGLGLLLLYFHGMYGFRTDISHLPDVTTRVQANGNIRVSIPDETKPYSQIVRHIGFQYLALVCFLDAAFSLIPWKYDTYQKSDGARLLENLSAPSGTFTTWCYNRLYASLYYGQSLASDEEWHDLRLDCLSLSKEEMQAPLLTHMAWMQTDPELYLAITETLNENINDADDSIKYKYIISRILMNEYDTALKALLPAKPKEDDIIYSFANALLSYAEGNKEEAIKTVKIAREVYLSQANTIPEEEKEIFKAIETMAPLPQLKWPPLS